MGLNKGSPCLNVWIPMLPIDPELKWPIPIGKRKNKADLEGKVSFLGQLLVIKLSFSVEFPLQIEAIKFGENPKGGCCCSSNTRMNNGCPISSFSSLFFFSQAFMKKCRQNKHMTSIGRQREHCEFLWSKQSWKNFNKWTCPSSKETMAFSTWQEQKNVRVRFYRYWIGRIVFNLRLVLLLLSEECFQQRRIYTCCSSSSRKGNPMLLRDNCTILSPIRHIPSCKSTLPTRRCSLNLGQKCPFNGNVGQKFRYWYRTGKKSSGKWSLLPVLLQHELNFFFIVSLKKRNWDCELSGFWSSGSHGF